MRRLKAWQHWQTESLAPSEATALHAASSVTIHRLFRHKGQRWVKYGYNDFSTIGLFRGRDSDSEEDFRKKFPVFVESLEPVVWNVTFDPSFLKPEKP